MVVERGRGGTRIKYHLEETLRSEMGAKMKMEFWSFNPFECIPQLELKIDGRDFNCHSLDSERFV